jgi:exopolyphosphatase/pppGpp-phosphohydrolase
MDVGGTPCAVLHLGEQETLITLCTHGLNALEPPLSLDLGTARTAQAFFRADVPTPLELETAIASVEDTVYVAHRQYGPWAHAAQGRVQWWSTDAALVELALLAGLPPSSRMVLTLETMEALFQRLTYVAQGRPAASEGLPERASFAAALLLLRELMHHMPFHTLHLVGPAQVVG